MIIQLLSQAVDLVHVLVRGAALALQDHNLLQLRLQFVVQLFRVVFVLRIQVLVLDSQLFYLLAIARDVKLCQFAPRRQCFALIYWFVRFRLHVMRLRHCGCGTAVADISFICRGKGGALGSYLLVQGSELIDLYLLALQLPLQLVLLCQQTLVPRFSV